MKSFALCFKGLMRTARPLRARLLLTCILGLGGVALSLFFVWCSKRVVDVATGEVSGDLTRFVVIFVATMLLQVVLGTVSRYWDGFVVVNAQNDTRARVFERVMRSVWSGKEKFHSGDTINRLEEDIRVVIDFICGSIPQIVITVVQLVAATWFLFKLSPQLGWILLFIMPVAVVCSRLFFRKMRRITRDIRSGDSKVQAHMQENLQHRMLVRSMGGTDDVLDDLSDLQRDVKRKTISRLNYSAISRTCMQLGFMAGYAAAFVWSVKGLNNHTVTYGLMTAFLQLVGQVQRPVASLAQQIPAFIRALSSEERLLELSEMEQESSGEDVRLEGAPGVRAEDLSFCYEGAQKPVFEHLSFDLKPGSMTAVLGSTGAGKSTLVKVIMSLLKPSAGRVVLYMDGVELESSPQTLCNFMYVPQGNSLMSGTIRQNLHLASPDATDEELYKVLHLAAADFVRELPDGLDTECAEVGAGLSEGQAQRIAIARALLRPGGILVLDEATSALDAETELELLENIKKAYSGSKTIICITHRPAATSYAEKELRLN